MTCPSEFHVRGWDKAVLQCADPQCDAPSCLWLPGLEGKAT